MSNTIVGHTENSIALFAKQPTNFSSFVVVVYGQPPANLGPVADRANSFLFPHQQIIIIDAEPILVSQRRRASACTSAR